MSLLARLVPQSSRCVLRAPLSTSALVRDVATPAKLGASESRDVAKEQADRNRLAVEAEVVNDAPRMFSTAFECPELTIL